MDANELNHRFINPAPSDPNIAQAIEQARTALSTCARLLDHLVPDGREQSVVVMKLEEAWLWAWKGIVQNQDAVTMQTTQRAQQQAAQFMQGQAEEQSRIQQAAATTRPANQMPPHINPATGQPWPGMVQDPNTGQWIMPGGMA
jgi:hypothetical protein